MKISIGARLFLTMLVTIFVMAAIGLELARWGLLDNFSGVKSSGSWQDPQPLVEDLAGRYKQNHGWTFVPAAPSQSKVWLREDWLQLQQAAHLDSDASLTGYRMGLLDKDGHRLAGVVANQATKTFASLDTRQTPIVVDQQIVGHLVLSRPQHPEDELAVAFLMDQQDHLLLIAIMATLLSALAAAVLAANFRRPIRDLVAGTRSLAAARFDTRVPDERRDELGELAETFNLLAQRLGDVDRSHQQWVADTSHELRTPLAVLRGQLEALQDGIRPATAENLQLMLQQISCLTKLVDDLGMLASADIGQLRYVKEDTDVWRLVGEAAEAFSERFRNASLTVVIGSPPAKVVVRCDRDRIHQVLTNLFENCVRYTLPGGRVEVHGFVTEREFHIAIDDTLPEVPQQALKHLGERFFRVDSSRSRDLGGTGLGLALSRQILEAHGGRLEFHSSPLGGLRALIVFDTDKHDA